MMYSSAQTWAFYTSERKIDARGYNNRRSNIVLGGVYAEFDPKIQTWKA